MYQKIGSYDSLKDDHEQNSSSKALLFKVYCKIPIHTKPNSTENGTEKKYRKSSI